MTAIEIKSLDDVIFQDRNKAYDAYQLRKNQHRNFILAMAIVYGTLVAAWGIERLVTYFSGTKPPEDIMREFTPEEIPPQWKEPSIQPTEPLQPMRRSSVGTGIVFTIVDSVAESNLVYVPETVETGLIESEGSETGIEGTTDGQDNGALQNGLLGEEEPEREMRPIIEQGSFPGGDEKMEAFIKSKFDFPEDGLEENSSVLVMYFEIDEQGKTENVKVLKSFPGGGKFEREAVRVLSSMPDWLPKKVNGKPVRMRREIRINCKL